MNFRILSLDGGGVLALIEIYALIAIYGETTSGHEVLADFDLVAATSGGSIVLGGLMEDIPLAQLKSYFEDQSKRDSIFKKTANFPDEVLEGFSGIGPK